MAETGIKIKNAPLTDSISGGMKMPISDGSDLPKTTSVTQLYNFVKSGLLNTDGFALTSNIPTRTSQLTNDSSFATTSQIPTAVSKLTNDSGFITETALAPYAKTANIPTKISQLTNDSKYATTSEIPTKVSQLDNDSGFITSAALEPYAKTANLPTKLSQFENDSKFISDTALAPYAKTADLPTKLSQFTNDSKFVSSDVTDAMAKEIADNTVNIDLMIEKKDSLGNAKAISLDLAEWPTLTGLPLMIVKSGAPAEIPSFIGQKYLDTKNKKAYLAFGVSSVSDWVVMN